MIGQLLAKLGRCLDDHNIPYMIIGGQAVLLYGTPRLTRDVDITLGADTDQFAAIADICNTLGLRILPEDAEAFAKETKVLPAEDSGLRIRVDFIFSFTSYEAQAIERAIDVVMDNHPVKFASCEDIIIHKMIAGRAIDEEDVKSMLSKNKGQLDLGYVRKWLLEFSQMVDHEAILDKFDNILRR
jgi:predicted nucleotidyltransferase